jgi:hypothetical protein
MIWRKWLLEDGEKQLRIEAPGIDPERGQGPASAVQPVVKKAWYMSGVVQAVSFCHNNANLLYIQGVSKK